MSHEIRPFTTDDYAACVAIANEVYPEYPETAEEWRFGDEHRSPKIRFQRYVATRDGRVVGMASFGQNEHMFHPRKFWVDVVVAPGAQRQGVGRALLNHLHAELAPLDPLTLWSSAREDYASGVTFLEGRGFQEVMREWENRLDVPGFDETPFAGQVDRVRETGLRLVTLAELADDPDRDRKLYELVDAVGRDVPSPDAHTSVDFEPWRERLWANPNLLADGYFLALDGDRYVGLSTLWASQGSTEDAYTGLTGTLREYRRRGIALALKLLAIRYASEAGFRVVKTWNETGNEGMLSINEQLGFVRQPAWIEYALDLAGD